MSLVSILQHGNHQQLSRHRLVVLSVLLSSAIGAMIGLGSVYLSDLPQIHDLEKYRPITETVLFDDQGQRFASFALQRRKIAQYEDYPRVLYDAVLSIEDKDFEHHPGYEVWRMIGAANHDIATKGAVQGASTLTMQLARNLFLSPARTYRRKMQEIVLAIQIERHFTKPQIFTLYANQIYLGHGVYGFASGAEFYFGKPVQNLKLEEAALLAALPKAPNSYSPIRNPEHAIRRRNVVIDCMLRDGKVNRNQALAAKNKPLGLQIRGESDSLAPYFVEEVRHYLEKKYGTEQVHESGLKVYTSLDTALQRAANDAVLDGLAAYERRHGWRGDLPNIGAGDETLQRFTLPEWQRNFNSGTYTHALVTSASPRTAWLRLGQYKTSVDERQVAWTNRSIAQLLSPGDIVYVKLVSFGPGLNATVRLEQESLVQGALVAVDNSTGRIMAMTGGRDYAQSKFNRATQALRQVGSSFKPYVYTAAIDQGGTPEDLILDAPVTIMTASGPYTPRNYDEKFKGMITLKHALAESRNIPAIRVAEQVGMKTVIGYAHRFGISRHIPAYLPVALGAVELTLLEHTLAFSAFPNDGLLAAPSYIIKVTDYNDRVLEENYPVVRDVVSARTARVMTSMLQEVVLHGTASAASRMGSPLAGKTGTTNDFTDAWFIGFSPSTTCGVWVGFDEKKSLGDKETGAKAALPIWMQFMAKVLVSRQGPHEFSPARNEAELRLTANRNKTAPTGQFYKAAAASRSLETSPDLWTDSQRNEAGTREDQSSSLRF